MSLKRLDQEDITISVEAVTTSAWSGNTPEITAFTRNNDQINSTSGKFFHEVSSLGEVQFSIAYGNITGAGAVPFTADVTENTPTSVTYKQYRNLIFGTEEESQGVEKKFKIGGVDSDEILVINIDRSRYKEKLLPGSLEINIGGTVYTDNSSTQTVQIFTDAGREFSIVDSGGTEVGKLYPDIGVLIFRPQSITVASSTTPGETLTNFFNAIVNGASFKLQSEETLSSNIVFIRARNAEFNYTTNPSIITSDGEIRDPVLVNSPQTFITTVGLYNDRNELLAVAKLSRPLLKDFTKEALLRIKLDF